MNSRGRRSNGKALGRFGEHRSRLVTGSMIIFEAFDPPFVPFGSEGKQFSLLGGETGRVTGRTMASTFHDVNRFPRGRAGRDTRRLFFDRSTRNIRGISFTRSFVLFRPP